MSSTVVRASCVLFAFLLAAWAQSNSSDQPKIVPLTVSTGVPLRVYLTKRLSKRLDEPVHAKVIEPVFAFDRLVIPAGADVLGTVSRLEPVSKTRRATAILAGDLTPLHDAQVQFTELTLPDGRHLALHTVQTIGLNSIFTIPRPKKQKPSKNAKNPPPPGPSPNGGILGTGKRELRNQIQGQINARTRGMLDVVRAPNKTERLEEFLVMKLPYHPQWVRNGTRFDAELREPLLFGSAEFKPESLTLAGSTPPPDSVVHARLITPLNSVNAKMGEKVEAIVSQPLFSADQKLILPEGTHLIGGVTNVHPARWFHRGGQLRFTFQRVELPPGIAALAIATAFGETPARRTVATLDGAESTGKTPIKVDDEGGVKSVEPKTRFIAPVLTALIATRSLDNDEGRRTVGTHEGNAGNRTLAGASGFGLLGTLAAQTSRTLSSVLGFYGMGWSVYSNIISRGGEVEFENNAVVDIRFGSRAHVPGTKFRDADSVAGGGSEE